MAKPELEFFPVTNVGWAPVPGSACPGLEERVLAGDGPVATRVLRFSPGPPMLLVCFIRGSRTATAISRAARFGVNVLSARQEAISNHFARRGEDHFAEVPLTNGPLGVPLITNAIAQLVCTVAREIDG